MCKSVSFRSEYKCILFIFVCQLVFVTGWFFCLFQPKRRGERQPTPF
ncbi:hypothetical protein HMPREF0262_01135 [Clostridium sp. ATCC 29733]|nr:hypothetical protein HMPREF0262_01135 [Clostridium sp. ATCC 29733]